VSGQEGVKHHFTVHTTSCYTCHFNNEGFNTGTNRCLMCHTLPTGQITVHEGISQEHGELLRSPELTEKTVKMDHATILERKVGCISCHADVASEDAPVTRRECERCHDLPKFFTEFKQPFTLELVQKYHELHVPHQRAKCLDCHSEIHHQLIREGGEADEEDPAIFLTSVMSKCANCHPNHHAEQLSMLRGKGGTTVPHGTPNLMFGSRTNCYGCHSDLAASETSGDVLQATLNGCIACHGDRHVSTFENWKQGLQLAQADADEAYSQATARLAEAQNLTPEVRTKVTQLLREASADMQLVKRGHGLHNVTFAIELLDGVAARSREAVSLMTETNAPP
jgi:hypothetical protein